MDHVGAAAAAAVGGAAVGGLHAVEAPEITPGSVEEDTKQMVAAASAVIDSKRRADKISDTEFAAMNAVNAAAVGDAEVGDGAAASGGPAQARAAQATRSQSHTQVQSHDSGHGTQFPATWGQRGTQERTLHSAQGHESTRDAVAHLARGAASAHSAPPATVALERHHRSAHVSAHARGGETFGDHAAHSDDTGTGGSSTNPFASAPTPLIRAPRGGVARNVPEMILFGVDVSTEHRRVLDEVRASIKLLVQTKAQLGDGHSFGLAALGAEFVWLLDFTTDLATFMMMLDQLAPAGEYTTLDLDNCFRGVAEKVNMSLLGRHGRFGSHILRLVMIHSRTKAVAFPESGPGRVLLSAPGFFCDMLHICPGHSRSARQDGTALLEQCAAFFADSFFQLHSLPPDARLFRPCIAAHAAHALHRPERVAAQYGLVLQDATL